MKWPLTLFWIAILLVFGACQGAGSAAAAETGSGSAGAENLPHPRAKAFWTYIHKTHPYTKWQMWPGKHGLYPGRSPHGAFLKLYVNDIAHKAAKAHRPMPDGAILVKENYAKDKTTLLSITPMYKTDRYNPAAGNWFWAKYGPDGKAMKAGKVKSCIECHKNATGFVFTPSK